MLAVQAQTIDCLSMQCFGYYERERPGEIYRQILEIGRIRIVVFVVGETMEFGKSYWRR